MVRGDGKLDELHRCFFGVVVEGFHDVVGVIDHVQFSCSQGQERALEKDGEKDNEECDVEDYIVRRRLGVGHNGKYDGRRAAKSREGGERHDSLRCAEGRHEPKDRKRASDEGHEEGDEESRPCHIRELRWRREKSQEEEDHHLHQIGGAVEEVNDIFLAFELAISQNDAGDVSGEIAVAVQHGRSGVGKNRDGRHENHVKAAGEIGSLFQCHLG